MLGDNSAEEKNQNQEKKQQDGEKKQQDGEEKQQDGEKKQQDEEKKQQDGEEKQQDVEEKQQDEEKKQQDGEEKLQDEEEKQQDEEEEQQDGGEQQYGEEEQQDSEEKQKEQEMKQQDGEEKQQDGEEKQKYAEKKQQDEKKLQDGEEEQQVGEQRSEQEVPTVISEHDGTAADLSVPENEEVEAQPSQETSETSERPTRKSRLTCEVCSASFRDGFLLNRHQKVASSSKDFNLQTHFYLTGPHLVPKEVFSCSYCQCGSFSKADQLMHHQMMECKAFETHRVQTDGDQSGSGVDQSVSAAEKSGTDADKSDADVGKSSTDVEKPSTDADKSGTDADVGKSGTAVEKSGTDADKSDVAMDQSDAAMDQSDAAMEQSDVAMEQSDVAMEQSDVAMEDSDNDIEISIPDSESIVPLEPNLKSYKWFKCYKCSVSFSSEQLLIEHCKFMTRSVDFDDKTHQSFGSMPSVKKRDIELTSDERDCSYCSEVFSCGAQLAQHQAYLCAEFRKVQDKLIDKAGARKSRGIVSRSYNRGGSNEESRSFQRHLPEKKAFHCRTCSEGFDTMTAFSVHTLLMATSKSFDRNHLYVRSPDAVGPRWCQYCSKSFGSDEKLKSHQVQHCQRQAIASFLKQNYPKKYHGKEWSSSNPFCWKCLTDFSDAKEYRRHVQVMQRSVDFRSSSHDCKRPNTEKLQCSYCDLEMEHDRDLMRHQQSRCPVFRIDKPENFERKHGSENDEWIPPQDKGSSSSGDAEATANKRKKVRKRKKKPFKRPKRGVLARREQAEYVLAERSKHPIAMVGVGKAAQEKAKNWKAGDPISFQSNFRPKYEFSLVNIRCPKCPFRFVDGKHLKLHVNLVTCSRDWDNDRHLYIPDKQPWNGCSYTCSYCNLIFGNKVELQQHQIMGCQKFPFQCCPETGNFKHIPRPTPLHSSKKVADLEVFNYSRDTVHCTLCKQIFPPGSEIRVHRHLDLMNESDDFNTCHEYVGATGSAFVCSYCGRKLSSREDLELHQIGNCKMFSLSVPINAKKSATVPAEDSSANELGIISKPLSGSKRKEDVRDEEEIGNESQRERNEDERMEDDSAEDSVSEEPKIDETSRKDSERREDVPAEDGPTNESGKIVEPQDQEQGAIIPANPPLRDPTDRFTDTPTCSICFLKFHDMTSLEQHHILMTESVDFSVSHSATPFPELPSFKCSYCDLSFHDESESMFILMKHQARHCPVFTPSRPGEILAGVNPVTLPVTLFRDTPPAQSKFNVRKVYEKLQREGRTRCDVCKADLESTTYSEHRLLMRESADFCEKTHLYIGDEAKETGFHCSYCKMGWRTNEALRRHQRKQCLKMLFTAMCELCDISLPNNDDLKRHYKWVERSIDCDDEHNVGRNAGEFHSGRYSCLYCGRAVAVEGLESHQATNCWRSRYSPIIRGNPEETVIDEMLLKPKARMTFKGKFSCPICFKKCSSATIDKHFCLLPHSVDFTKNIKFQGNVVGVKKGEKRVAISDPYQCSYCKDRFQSIDFLKVHQQTKCQDFRLKLEENPDRCEVCSFPFLIQGKYMHETLMAKSIDFQSSTHNCVKRPNATKFSCSYCLLIFTERKDLEIHQYETCMAFDIFSDREDQDPVDVSIVDSAEQRIRAFAVGRPRNHHSSRTPRVIPNLHRLRCNLCDEEFSATGILSHNLLMEKSKDFKKDTHKYVTKHKRYTEVVRGPSAGYSCSYCSTRFKRRRDLEKHQYENCTEFNLSAEKERRDMDHKYCSVETYQQSGQKKGTSETGGRSSPLTGAYTCRKCDKGFPLTDDLYAHNLLMRESWDFDKATHICYKDSQIGCWFRCSYCFQLQRSADQLAKHQILECSSFSLFAGEENSAQELSDEVVPTEQRLSGQEDSDREDSDPKADGGEVSNKDPAWHPSDENDEEEEEESCDVERTENDGDEKGEEGKEEGEEEEEEDPAWRPENVIHEKDVERPESEECVEYPVKLPTAKKRKRVRISGVSTKDESKKVSRRKPAVSSRPVQPKRVQVRCKMCGIMCKSIHRHRLLMAQSKDFNLITHAYQRTTDIGGSKDPYMCSYCWTPLKNRLSIELHQMNKCDDFQLKMERQADSMESGQEPSDGGEAPDVEKKDQSESEGSEEYPVDGSPLKKKKRSSPENKKKASSSAVHCDTCERSFFSKSALESHRVVMLKSVDFDRRTHNYSGTTGMSLMGKKLYQCSYCPEDFPSMGGLEEHQMDGCIGTKLI